MNQLWHSLESRHTANNNNNNDTHDNIYSAVYTAQAICESSLWIIWTTVGQPSALMMATIWLCVHNKYNIWLVRGDVRGPRTGVWSLAGGHMFRCYCPEFGDIFGSLNGACERPITFPQVL